MWSDDYWPLLMQLFLKKPVGVKPLYSRPMVALSLELHIAPETLYRQMFRLRTLETPSLRHLWDTYGNSPRRLQKAADRLRRMEGLGNHAAFYDGVAVNETFERRFRPIPGHPSLTPAMLVMTLDLYFRLTPNTMVSDTPEVQQLARMMRVSPSDVTETMAVYQQYDPFLRRKQHAEGPLAAECKAVWDEFGNGEPETLSAFAAQLREYFM